MTRVASVRLLGVCTLAVLFPAAAHGQWDSSSARTIAPGVVHRRLVVNSGPWRMNVLEIDLRRPDISLRGVKGNDAFASREKLTSMAGRYKGPGRVVAAVNTDFFDVRTGESENNVVIEGAMKKGVTLSDSPHDKFNARHSQLGVDWNNHAFIERFALDAKLIYGGRTAKLDGINYRPPYPDAITLFTPFAGDSTTRDTTGRNTALVPLKLVRQTMNEIVFTVAGNAKEGGRLPTQAGAVLIGDGERREEVRSIARRGGTIRITTALWPGHGKLRTVAGGWPVIVNDGKSVAEYADIVEGTFPRFSATRHPRTAAGISQDGSTLYLVTVDGRRESDSGMSLSELATTMMQLGAYEAMNFDGGGSTTMVIDGQVVNRPSDQAGERPIGSGLLIVFEGERKGKE
jgi:hypothetical protein